MSRQRTRAPCIHFPSCFYPGVRSSLDLGYRLEAADRLGLMVQLNLLHRRRDSGSDAEPANSFSRSCRFTAS